MERFIRLNRSILDCDLAKGGWRLDEEGIAAIEDEIAELVRIIAQSHRGDIPRESAAFAEFRRTCLAVMVRLKEVLPDEYDLLEQTERAEIRFLVYFEFLHGKGLISRVPVPLRVRRMSSAFH